MSKEHTIVSIDYSMSCPAVTVHIGNKWSFKNCKFNYITQVKKFEIKTETINSILYKDWVSDEERYDYLSEWVIEIITKASPDLICMEGYSFASHGRGNSIGELTGLLKHKIWDLGYSLHLVPPTVIKKFAVGKGNAQKDILINEFKKETKFDIEKFLGCGLGKSPASDIVDSYFLGKYAKHTLVKD